MHIKINRYAIVLVVLFHFLSVEMLFAQRATSKIIVLKDRTTDEAIIGAVVTNGFSKTLATSDDKGVVMLPEYLQEGEVVNFSGVGYQTLTIVWNANYLKGKRTTFYLLPDQQNLPEVTVTAKSNKRNLKEQPIPISVITMSDLAGTVTSVNDVLARTAGITVRNSGATGAASRLSVRGLEGKRIGIFIDEIPMSENNDFLDLNDIPVDMIERIEIYKGIVPPKLGGSAIGGAVNIVLKEYPEKYLDVSYSIKSFNTHQFNTVLKRNDTKRHIEYGLGAVYTYADNDYKMESPYNKGQIIKRDHDKYQNYMVGTSIRFTDLWFDEFKIEPAFTKVNSQVQGIEHNIQEARNISDNYILATHLEREAFFLPKLHFDFHTQYAYSIFQFIDKAPFRYNWDGTTYQPVSKYGGEIGTHANNSYNQKHSVANKLNLDYALNEKHNINLNLVYNFTRGIPKDELKDLVLGYKTSFNSTMHSFTAGLTYEVKSANSKWLNALSAKYYYYAMRTRVGSLLGLSKEKAVHLNKSDYGFSNAVRYALGGDLFLKASIAYDVRLPADTELLGDGFMVVPSATLKPERNLSGNVGLYWDRSFKRGGKLQMELNFFAMRLEDMIRYTGGSLQTQYQNFGKMRTLGADFEMKWDVTNFLYLYGNVTYQDLRDVRKREPNSQVDNPTEGDRIPNIPYLYCNGGVELHKNNLFGGAGQQSRLYVESAFVEEYFYDFEQSIYQERRIPSSFSTDIGLEHSFNNKRIVLGIQVNNIMDAKRLTEFNRPLPGRSFAAKLRYILK